MEVLILQVFVSLVLVLGSILLFAYSTKQRDHQHGGHLALLPLEGDSPSARPTSARPEKEVTR